MRRIRFTGTLSAALLALAACAPGTPPATEPAVAEPTATRPAPSATPTDAPTATPIPPTPTPQPTPYVPTPPDEPCVPSETRACVVLFVVPQQDFNYREYSRRAMFEGLGYAVAVASTTTDPARGYYNVSGKQEYVQPDVALVDVDVTDYDAIFFVGGDGAGLLVQDADARRVIREALEQGRVLVGQCAGVMVLAGAGVLEGRTVVAPVPQANCPVLEAGGATCGRGDVARDGPIVTSTGPQPGIVFAAIEAIEELIP